MSTKANGGSFSCQYKKKFKDQKKNGVKEVNKKYPKTCAKNG